MASTTPHHSALLDQLETEVKRVLEQTGRVFASVGKDGRFGPAAQAFRLKQLLPESMDRFHGALDQLEEELQLAKLVMRRDLALWKEQSGVKGPIQAVVGMPSDSGNQAGNGTADQAEPHQPGPEDDVTMEDAPSEPLIEAIETEAPSKSDQVKGATEQQVEEPAQNENKSNPDQTVPSDTQPADPNQPADSNRPADANQSADTSQPADANQTADANQPADTNLHIDTQASAPPVSGEDKDIETGGISATNDLESLFGPNSAATEFNMDTNSNGDFDFGFNTAKTDNDNDNIDNLLPGLHDWANGTQPSDANNTDFSLFSGLASDDKGGIDQAGAGDNGDFDDFFDLTAELGDFSAENKNGDGNGDDVDFNFDFNK